MAESGIEHSIDPASVHRTVLPNGLTVVIRRDSSAPVVAIVTYVKAGYFDETDDVIGIAHVLEHMYFKGTPARGVGEIARETKASGGYLNAATIYDHTVYYTVLPSSGFVAGLDIQFDAYANSLIDADELRRELEVIIQEANRKADNPGAVSTETLYEVMHDRHRIRRWRIGREDALRRLDRDAMMKFYRNFYHPGVTVLSIVGDVDPETALAEVTERYGRIAAGTPENSPGEKESSAAEFRYRELTGDIAQTQIAFGWHTPGTLDPVTPQLDILAAILGGGRASRMYRSVREKKFASGVSVYNYTPTELGVFVVHAEAPPEKAGDAARTMWAQLDAIRETGVTDEEVFRAKRLFESRWIRRLEDMEGQANYIAEWEALGGLALGDEYLSRAMEVTAADVTELARRFLDPDGASVVVYRPKTASSLGSTAVEMRAYLDNAAAAELFAAEPPVSQSAAVHTRLRIDREEAAVRVYRTEHGIPLLVRRKQGALVHAGVWALGGARDESAERAGMTNMLVRTAVKGTQRRSAAQIAGESELLGGSVSGSASSDSFGWSVSVPARYASEALELLADVSQNPKLADEALETERALEIAALDAVRDDMYRYPMRLATMAAYAGHPYGTPVSGDRDTLERLSSELLREWHSSRFLSGETVIGITGDADHDELAAIASAHFTELRGGVAPRLEQALWTPHMEQRVQSREKTQTALAILFEGPSRGDDARFAAHMIAGVASGLGGRFFDELRDRQSLGYTVHAMASERPLGGTFAAYIATSPEKEEIARDGLLREFAKLREAPVTARELDQAKTYAIGTHAIRQQSGGAVLGDIIEAWLFGELAELNAFEERIRSVTAGQMQELARRYFVDDRRVEGVIRGSVPAARS